MDAAQPVEVAVLVVCHNGRHHLEDCLGSLATAAPSSAADPQIRLRTVVVDNASSDGSAEFVRGRFPSVDCVPAPRNLGFAAGNNFGWEHVRARWPAVRYLCLLNQDTVVTPGWLGPLVGHLEAHAEVAAVQPKVMLHPEVHRFNTAGNRSHFLGFGFVTGYREEDRGQFDRVCRIDFASGAACVLRASAVEKLGLFNDGFFMYLEDAELGWRLAQAGQASMFVPGGVVQHKYAFRRDFAYYYYLERNRFWLLLVYYRWRTLALLLPAILFMEAGQLWFAWRQGVLGQKARAYGFFLARENRARVRAERRAAARRRTVGDRAFTRGFLGRVAFSEIDSPLLRFVANPVLGAYWAIARRLIFW
jgi:GT2 family glycosyltransferase